MIFINLYIKIRAIFIHPVISFGHLLHVIQIIYA